MTSDIATQNTDQNILQDSTHTWAQPTPLAQISMPETPYPLEALPSMIQKTVAAYHQYGQQPLSLIGSSALANISLACHSQANVARDHYLVSRDLSARLR